MIDNVNKKSPNFLKGIYGSKKALEKIINDYNFKDMQYEKSFN